jgi:hypothetical protein
LSRRGSRFVPQPNVKGECGQRSWRQRLPGLVFRLARPRAYTSAFILGSPVPDRLQGRVRAVGSVSYAAGPIAAAACPQPEESHAC